MEFNERCGRKVAALIGCGERRRRLLPARAVVYFVLALRLFSSSDSAGPPVYGRCCAH
ncbi:transposase domain-containing protein [Streptomyces sp. NPDC020096]